MLPALDELAHHVLELKQYGRLEVVAGLLSMFSKGAWDEIEDDAKVMVLGQMEKEFHFRAWDDWASKEGDAYSRITAFVTAEQKGMSRKTR